MSTDRELLEAAARVAGFALLWSSDPTRWPYKVDEFGNPEELWNPLTDDGDALRLAVKLNLRINLWGGGMPVQVFNRKTHGADEPTGDDPCAATRRAIVRAAAAMADKQ